MPEPSAFPQAHAGGLGRDCQLAGPWGPRRDSRERRAGCTPSRSGGALRLAGVRRRYFDGLGSTTFRRADLDGAFEADSCFYLWNVDAVRGKNGSIPWWIRRQISSSRSTSPNRRSTSVPSSPSTGIPEVWRYTGNAVQIHVLGDDGYVQRPESSVLPGVTDEVLTRFAEEIKPAKRFAWLRRVRAWAATLPT